MAFFDDMGKQSMRSLQLLFLIPAFLIGGAMLLGGADTESATLPHHDAPDTRNGNVVVALCDGKTSLEVKGLKPGETMNPDQAKSVADQLMLAWEKKNPGMKWDVAPETAKDAKGKIPAPGTTAPEKKQFETYGNYTSRDEFLWNQEYEKFIAEGNRIFHDAKAFGGTVGISCDMCHPNASNTHPETYPKFQVQLQRVALLRDMINWCIENPAKGKPLHDDDTRLRAMEAYIMSTRKGVPMAPGKH
jgi:thiosulfate dehydrogenase